MPNLFTHLDNGTLDNYTSGMWSLLNVEPAAGSQSFSRSNDISYAGGYCLRHKFGSAGGKYDLDYQVFSSFRSVFTPTVLTPGVRYIAKMKVKTPAAEPGLLGSDDVVIAMTTNNTLRAPKQSLVVNAGNKVLTLTNGDIITFVTVGQIKALPGWAEVSYEWTEPSTGTPGYRISYGPFVAASRSGLPADMFSPFGTDIFNSGILYMDSIEVLEVGACDLVLGAPSYTKSDESGVGLNNGSITVNVLSSYTREYSLDNVAWQVSNIFAGLAPGTYTVYVRDTNPNGCSLQINNIVILAYAAPPPPPPVVPGNLEIDNQPVNKVNFVSWFNALGDTAFNAMTFINCFWDLPRPYRIGKLSKKHYPVVVNLEQFSFYINFDEDFNHPNFSSFKLHLINSYGNVTSDIAPLERVYKDDNVNYFIYASVTLAAAVPGVYRLAVVDTADSNRILYVSQEIQVMTSDNAKKYTSRLQFRNSSSVYNYLYEKVALFLQEIRLRIYLDDEQPDGDLAQYRAVSSGRLRNVNVELDLSRSFETYFFDDLAHRAMFAFQIHDSIYINGALYVLKSMYKPSYVRSRHLNKGKIEFWEQAFSTANRYGDENVAIIEQEGPFLLGDNGGRIKL